MNTDLPVHVHREEVAKVTRERPLVTFAQLGYNQEGFIREAIEGAFSQTYEPLEIILSDDGSTDSTFEIMQEMAASYKGPHRVVLRRSPGNAGTLNHVLDVSAAARGELLILAEGDDVSKPERTTTLVDLWQDTGASGLSSCYDLIDEHGQVLARQQTSLVRGELLPWLSRDMPFLLGATSAFETRLLQCLPRAEQKIYIQDALFTFVLHLEGRTSATAMDALVNYRQNSGSFSNSGTPTEQGKEQIINFEARIARAAQSYISLADYMLELSRKYANTNRDLIAGVEDMRRFAEIRLGLVSERVWPRMRCMASARRKAEFRYALPRMFGLEAYVRSRLLVDRLTRAVGSAAKLSAGVKPFSLRVRHGLDDFG